MTPFLFAHRGSHRPGGPAENTLEAFEQAVRDGADGLETDLWATRDGQVFLFHDDDFAAFTHGRERRGVPEMTAGEVRRLGCPSLEEALDVVGDRLFLNLELKHGAALGATLRAVRARGLEDRVLLSSFVPEAVAEAAERAPDIERAVIMGVESWNPRVRFRESFPFWTLARCRASAWHPNHRLVSAPLVEALHGMRIRVNVWTVNDLRTARRLADMGVDGLFTDRPGALRAEFASDSG
jgi:glycerophosphoryl diester phosphodiesterase